MPTIAERLEQINLKVLRAGHHLQDLTEQVKRFLTSKPEPYAVELRLDPHPTKSGAYYMSRAEKPRRYLSLVAGDVIQNLASALDHLAYQIVCSDTNDNPPEPRKIYFPITDEAAKYTASFKARKLAGASQASVDAIDALQPYKGGTGHDFWVLQELNNIEKHRLLLLVGSSLRSTNLGAHMAREAKRAFGVELPVTDLFFKPADAMFPLKVGDEIFAFNAGTYPDDKMEFRFNVALYQPNVLEAQSVIESLEGFVRLVERTVTSLTPRLRASP